MLTKFSQYLKRDLRDVSLEGGYGKGVREVATGNNTWAYTKLIAA